MNLIDIKSLQAYKEFEEKDRKFFVHMKDTDKWVKIVHNDFFDGYLVIVGVRPFWTTGNCTVLLMIKHFFAQPPNTNKFY